MHKMKCVCYVHKYNCGSSSVSKIEIDAFSVHNYPRKGEIISHPSLPFDCEVKQIKKVWDNMGFDRLEFKLREQRNGLET